MFETASRFFFLLPRFGGLPLHALNTNEEFIVIPAKARPSCLSKLSYRWLGIYNRGFRGRIQNPAERLAAIPGEPHVNWPEKADCGVRVESNDSKSLRPGANFIIHFRFPSEVHANTWNYALGLGVLQRSSDQTTSTGLGS